MIWSDLQVTVKCTLAKACSEARMQLVHKCALAMQGCVDERLGPNRGVAGDEQ